MSTVKSCSLRKSPWTNTGEALTLPSDRAPPGCITAIWLPLFENFCIRKILFKYFFWVLDGSNLVISDLALFSIGLTHQNLKERG
jgi:hypothetical protein